MQCLQVDAGRVVIPAAFVCDTKQRSLLTFAPAVGLPGGLQIREKSSIQAIATLANATTFSFLPRCGKYLIGSARQVMESCWPTDSSRRITTSFRSRIAHVARVLSRIMTL